MSDPLDSAREYVSAVRGGQIAVIRLPQHRVYVEKAGYGADDFGQLLVTRDRAYCGYAERDESGVLRRLKRAIRDGNPIGLVQGSVVPSRVQEYLRGGRA